MTTRMLVDARHHEETRVAVVKGNKIEEFDFESAEHKQLKGNIYLAKVTRVEPSLQAAFVDYGGNRHGFLSFAEIHPDYYQIPKEDREKLLAEEAEHAAEEAALRAKEEEEEDEAGGLVGSDASEDMDDELVEVEKDESIDTIDVSEGQLPNSEEETDEDNPSEDEDITPEEAEAESEATGDGDETKKSGGDAKGDDGKKGGKRGKGKNQGRKRGGRGNRGAPKASDAARQKRMALRRRYKIQDVIQRRQVVLVQVVKEERGNKGAALTTYLSLAGRYCVLMPNTAHGGGISRKISSAGDRKRLKSIISDLSLPTSMGCIVRTAGLSRTKTEIKRDFDYLARLWDEIREKTLSANAPELIHSDSDMIKRAIRDIYNRDIEEVLVEGENGYRAAKDFMKLLMPSHSRRVKSYADPVSLFQRYGAEDQLSAMYQPEVQLPSGGYLVINPTEALVSIDINSGRSTREHGIEATAVKTNLEAANEIARQLRLRDMAGLVVIDFIDMDRNGNVRKVERAMRDALKSDRARIQVGRISSFGLMEMSRQRLRTGVLEASTKICPHCEGTGLVRTASSAALSALRLIEEEAAKGKASHITLRASQEATIYVLNSKRHEIEEIEKRYGATVQILPDGETEGAKMSIATSGSPPKNQPKFEPIIDNDDDDIIHADEDQDKPKRKRRRRGRRGRGNRADQGETQSTSENRDGKADAGEPRSSDDADAQASVDEDAPDKAEAKPKRPRKRKTAAAKDADSADTPEKAEAVAEAKSEEASEEKPKRKRAPRKKTAATEPDATADAANSAEIDKPKAKRAPRKKTATKETAESKGSADGDTQKEKPKRKPRASAKKKADEPDVQKTAVVEEKSGGASAGSEAEQGPDGEQRRGWWQRTFG